MTKRIDIVQCFWCDRRMTTDEALVDLRTGKIKCRECDEYDRAVRLANGD
jgi:hypothetical protein